MNDVAQLLAAADEALKNAHAPYSRLKVGAAILSATGKVHTGCNVESVAFPVGGCAERPKPELRLRETSAAGHPIGRGGRIF